MLILKCLIGWRLRSIKLFVCCIAVLFFSSCTVLMNGDPPGVAGTGEDKELREIADKLGVSSFKARVTGAGHFVDFRYRVDDPDKAADILDKRNKILLVDEKSGLALHVPETKIGPLRGTSTRPIKGKTYTVLFSNRGNIVTKGSKVTIEIGEIKIKGIIVE